MTSFMLDLNKDYIWEARLYSKNPSPNLRFYMMGIMRYGRLRGKVETTLSCVCIYCWPHPVLQVCDLWA